ncbi:MAG: hypothetical protein ACI970_001493, partial [Myxococcota bacterium]
ANSQRYPMLAQCSQRRSDVLVDQGPVVLHLRSNTTAVDNVVRSITRVAAGRTG